MKRDLFFYFPLNLPVFLIFCVGPLTSFVSFREWELAASLPWKAHLFIESWRVSRGWVGRKWCWISTLKVSSCSYSVCSRRVWENFTWGFFLMKSFEEKKPSSSTSPVMYHTTSWGGSEVSLLNWAPWTLVSVHKFLVYSERSIFSSWDFVKGQKCFKLLQEGRKYYLLFYF